MADSGRLRQLVAWMYRRHVYHYEVSVKTFMELMEGMHPGRTIVFFDFDGKKHEIVPNASL